MGAAMIFGMTVTPGFMEITGVSMGLALLFQLVSGMRWVKRWRAWQRKAHKWAGVAMVVVGVPHAIAGLTLFNGWTIG